MSPLTWKEIIIDLYNEGIINPDDSIIAEYEMTYSDYFKEEYIETSIDFIFQMYSIEVSRDMFKEELLQGNLKLKNGVISKIH